MVCLDWRWVSTGSGQVFHECPTPIREFVVSLIREWLFQSPPAFPALTANWDDVGA